MCVCVCVCGGRGGGEEGGIESAGMKGDRGGKGEEMGEFIHMCVGSGCILIPHFSPQFYPFAHGGGCGGEGGEKGECWCVSDYACVSVVA